MALQQFVGAPLGERAECGDRLEVAIEFGCGDFYDLLDVEALLIGFLPPDAERVRSCCFHTCEGRGARGQMGISGPSLRRQRMERSWSTWRR